VRLRRDRSRLLVVLLLSTLFALPRSAHAAVDFRWEPPVAAPPSVALQTPRTTTVVTDALSLQNFSTDANNVPIPQDISISFPDAPRGWEPSSVLGRTVRVPAPTNSTTPGTLRVPLRFVVPAFAVAGRYVLTIRASTTERVVDALLTITLTAPGPIVVPEPACPEVPEPGNSFNQALLIRVDLEQRFGICRVGDEDWFKFGGVVGKLYTIDVVQQDLGLDLAIELYDENRNLLDSNDDFPFRGGTQTLTDTRPLIQSFRAPRSAFYTVRVRDTLGIGGADLGYRLVVRGESFGLNPPIVPSLCNDAFEQDGLPEIASTITANQTQKMHLLCPSGDADWIRFFALAGNRYYVYTNTRPYAGNDEGIQPGADTILFLFNRDGLSLIDSNDNIPGGTTLDSLVQFVPSADGVYFAQVKNVGDVGGMFIKYDLTLRVCPPVDLQPGCAPPADILPPPPVPAEQPAAAPVGAVAPEQVEFLPETGESETLVTFAQTAPADVPSDPQFVSSAFEQLWTRSDLAVSSGRAARSWVWGPAPGRARSEPFAEAAGGLRQVQYFDKGRMEAGTGAEVTAGLLVAEMIYGRVQVGADEYSGRAPAQIALAGDESESAATYASLAAVAIPAVDRTGELPRARINRAGEVAADGGPAVAATRLARFVPESGHNIPQVFWRYLTARGPVYEGGVFATGALMDWVRVTGYPISEPYWVRATIGGAERDVLVQAFERRILTYSPAEPPGWQVQMGNVGRHYYRWRYGEELP
jgi:hypothetical protein